MSDNNTNSLRNCKKCGRLFSSADSSGLCSRCNTDADDSFTKVREYIYDNPASSVAGVSRGTGISTDVILKWIREERIVLSENTNITFCERCNEPSEGNRFCAKCVHELTTGLKNSIKNSDSRTPQRSNHFGMHIREKK